MSNVSAAPGAAGLSFLDRRATIAKAGFNRWLVPPAALAIHLCIGMAYGFSVFWVPLGRAVAVARGLPKPIACPGDASTFFGKLGITGHALFATDCDWTQFDLGWMFTLFFVLLGVSAAIWGGWLERVGPRKAGVVAAFCWAGGLVLGAVGIYIHQLWLMWLGFGGGAMIGMPLANLLMNYFKTSTSVGAWQTFLSMGAIYFFFMMVGAFRYRLPPVGWRPDGWTPPSETKTLITQHHVHLRDAHKTPQFWLIWWVLCLNVSAGIGVIGMASPMLQEIFGGKLIGHPELGFNALSGDQKAAIAAIAAGFAGLLSLFNIGGRFFWASLSDYIGRKNTYYTFFILGIALYASAPFFAQIGNKALFVLAFGIILSMYGGGFATVPAYLADIFGTLFVGAIHGRLLTAWSTAGIIGPVVVNYIRETQLAAGVSRDHLYDFTMYILCGMLVVGLICNLLVKPVDPKWHMNQEDVTKLQAAGAKSAAGAPSGSFGIGKGGLDWKAVVFWSFVGIPLAWGVWITLKTAAALFQ